VTEAAQSRLTAIAGSRDDLPSVFHVVRNGGRAPERSLQLCWTDVTDVNKPTFSNVADELSWLTALVAQRTPAEPLLVDLSTDRECPVVRVVVPGCRFDVGRIHPEI
jgi:ribosomal protein S12 methylthiotransferase accessory factor